jgi:hypothetical protein
MAMEDDGSIHPAGPQPKLGWRKQLIGNVLVLPVLLWVALRWNLTDEREAPGVNWPAPLSLAPDPDALVQALMWWGGAVLVAALVLRWAWARWARPGTRVRQVVLWVLLALWALVWLGGSGAAWREQANQRGLAVQRTESFKLVAVQQVPASSRGVGGARLFVEWPEQGGLHRVVVENPSPALLAKPERVTLKLAPGRWQGWFVLGWELP